VEKRIISAVKRVEFVGDSCPWCHNIAVNIHAPTEDKKFLRYVEKY
jgi:hypothetical protein